MGDKSLATVAEWPVPNAEIVLPPVLNVTLGSSPSDIIRGFATVMGETCKGTGYLTGTRICRRK